MATTSADNTVSANNPNEAQDADQALENESVEGSEGSEDDTEDYLYWLDCDCRRFCAFCDAFLTGNASLVGLEWCGCERCLENALWDQCDMDPNVEIWSLDYMIDGTESIYTEGRKLTRYLAGLAVDYERCTIDELKKFCRDRGLERPLLPFRPEYVRVLERADRNATFRFMDLPAEMRNEVYQYLLILPGGDPNCNNCYTSILQTCKEVHREATSILYGENTIHCSYILKAHDHRQLSREIRVHNSRVSHGKGYGSIAIPFENIPRGMDDFPEFLKRMPHIHVHLRYEELGDRVLDAKGFHELNHFLANLASALMDEHRIKSLEVSLELLLEGPNVSAGSKTAFILFPLRRLRRLENIIINGNVSDTICKKLFQEVTRTDDTFNTMRCLKDLLEESQTLELLVDRMDGLHHRMRCQCDELCYADAGSNGPFARYLRVRQGKIQECAREAFSSTDREVLLQARLFDFRRWLDRVDGEDLQQKFDDFGSARLQRSEAETSTMAHYLSSAAWKCSNSNQYHINQTEADLDLDWK